MSGKSLQHSPVSFPCFYQVLHLCSNTLLKMSELNLLLENRRSKEIGYP